MSYQSKCTDCGKCRDLTAEDENFICFNNAKKICGQEYSVENILKEVLKDKSFYQTSGGGVTFSGGECMLHIDFLKEILQKCKENDIHTAVDTAGNVPWHYFEKIMSCTDLFLYDVKCFSEQLHKTETGITNELILENLKKLSDKFKGDIIIRIPVVTGFNDDIEEIIKISEFLKDIHYSYIEILPYHKMGEHKYEALGIKCFEYAIPEKENIEKYKKILNI